MTLREAEGHAQSKDPCPARTLASSKSLGTSSR